MKLREKELMEKKLRHTELREKQLWKKELTEKKLKKGQRQQDKQCMASSEGQAERNLTTN